MLCRYNYLRMDGSTAVGKRQALVEKFNKVVFGSLTLYAMLQCGKLFHACDFFHIFIHNQSSSYQFCMGFLEIHPSFLGL